MPIANQVAATTHLTRWHSLCLPLLLAAALSSGCGAGAKQQETLKQADFHYQMGTNHFTAGETAQAIRELTLALELVPQHADAHHLLGFLYLGRMQYPEAVRHFRAALDTNPDLFTCKNNLGVAYLYMERWEDAAAVYEDLRRATLYTSPWLAYANLGWAYYKMGRLQEAIEETKMALFLNPEMCLAANNLGIIYADLQLENEAFESFKEAISACPNYAEPHLHIGRLYGSLGNSQRAVSHFRKCVELSPRSDLGHRCRNNIDLYRN